MKKGILALSIILLLGLCTGCSSEGKVKRDKPQSTDLTAVNVNEIVLGVSSKSLDLTKYSAVPNEQTADEKNTQYFEELQITTDDDGVVTLIKGIVGPGTRVNVNDSQPLSISEVLEKLGSNYNEYWFDREQNIKAYTYYDEIQKIYATFATFDDNLIWLILNE